MYCRIFLSKDSGQFHVGIFGSNNKLMFISQNFDLYCKAQECMMKMSKLLPTKPYDPKPTDYYFGTLMGFNK